MKMIVVDKNLKFVLIFCLLGIMSLIAHETFKTEKFEYRIEHISDYNFTDEMNSCGDDGWELAFARRAIDTTTDRASYEVIFKRRK